jgi:two-component system, NarL family, invasion response regulator UvrY
MIRLIIADDHPIVREGLRYVVAQSRDIQVVAEAAEGDEAIRIGKDVAADVLLLDVAMPGPGVFEVISELKAARPRLRILVLSVHAEEHYGRRILKAGADGYLTKNYSSQVLAAAIRQVHTGHKYISPTLAEELALDLARDHEGQPHETLSNREYQVLLQLGSGRSIAQIAEQLGLSEKTVRTYRSRIMEKAGFKSTAEMIFYVLQRGLVTGVEGNPPSKRRQRRSH